MQSVPMIHRLIFRGLLESKEFFQRVVPYLSVEYFYESTASKVFVDELIKYSVKYNSAPTLETLFVQLEERKDIIESDYDVLKGLLQELKTEEKRPDTEWLLSKTEEFCQDAAVFLAVKDATVILSGDQENKRRGKAIRDKGCIPEILSEALSVSFDSKIGHDFIVDSDERLAFYKSKEEKLPFHIDELNKATNGGVTKKTLNVFISGTNVGKSLVLCDLAANAIKRGKNVLYITLEMSEKRVAARIDANLLDIGIDELPHISEDLFRKKIEKLRSSENFGTLIVKEYPTSSAHVGHFRHLLQELKLKKEFHADVIMVDYINICASARLKLSGAVNTYSLIKSIAEELRGLAVEFDVPIFSATQTTRSGMSSSDVELGDTSESIGLPQTVDWMAALMQPEEMAKVNQYLVKQLKSRYSDINMHRKFVIGVDKRKMRLFNVEASAQNISKDLDDIPPPTYKKQRNDEHTDAAWETRKKQVEQEEPTAEYPEEDMASKFRTKFGKKYNKQDWGKFK